MNNMMKAYALSGLLLFHVVNSQIIFPPNDECSNATVIPANVAKPYNATPVNIRFATERAGEPVTSCAIYTDGSGNPSDGASLWYVWTPLVAGIYQINTDGSYVDEDGTFEVQTTIGIFEGNTCALLVETQCTYPGDRLRPLNFRAGRKYYIKVATTDNVVGGKLIVNVVPRFPPANSLCTGAVNVNPSLGGTFKGDLTSAVFDADSSLTQCGSIGGEFKGLWYKIVNPLSSALVVSASTCSESEADIQIDTLITVYKGNSCGNLECVNGVDDGSCGLLASLGFRLEPQSTYYVVVQTFDFYEGNFTLSITSNQNYFELINSETDEFVDFLGDTVTYGSSFSKLNIRAVFEDESVIESVQVTFDDPAVSFCEQFAPYSVFRDKEGDYYDEVVPLGTHTVTAKSYAQAGCTGSELKSISKTFEMKGCDIGFSIYETTIGCYVDGLFQFSPPAVFDSFPCEVNIEAYPYCDVITETVKFELLNTATNRIVASRTEREFPYYLFGNDINSGLNSGSIDPGSYNLTLIINGVRQPSVSFSILNECDANYDCVIDDSFPGNRTR